MIRNLSSLRTETLRRLKTNSNTVTNAVMTDWANESQQEVLQFIDPDHLRKESTLTLVANQRRYLLEFEYNKILSVVDETNEYVVCPASESELETLDPDRDETGNVIYYALDGLEYVDAQPLSAATVDIVSDSTSDTTQSVRVNGVVGGVDDTELITLNGTTTATSTKSFSSIHQISKSATTVGKVTVNVNDASNTVVATFGPSELGIQRQPVTFYPLPGSTDTLRVRGIRQPRPMVNAEDFPDYPSMYHELILLGMVIRGHKDRMRHKLADELRRKEYNPMIARIIREQGNTRGRKSPVIKSASPQVEFQPGRLPTTAWG